MQDLDTFIHLFFLRAKCVDGPGGIIAIEAVALQWYLNDEYKGEVDRAAFTNILHAAGLSGGARGNYRLKKATEEMMSDGFFTPGLSPSS